MELKRTHRFWDLSNLGPFFIQNFYELLFSAAKSKQPAKRYTASHFSRLKQLTWRDAPSTYPGQAASSVLGSSVTVTVTVTLNNLQY